MSAGSPPPGWRPLDSGFWQPPPEPPPPLDADKLRAHLAELTPDEQREAAMRYMITYTATRPAPLLTARYALPDAEAEPEAELPPDPPWLRNVLLAGALALIAAITAALIIWPDGLGQR